MRERTVAVVVFSLVLSFCCPHSLGLSLSFVVFVHHVMKTSCSDPHEPVRIALKM